MHSSICLNMIQVSRFHWIIVSSKGNLVQSNIYFQNEASATNYIRNYTSSFNGWVYKVFPINADKINTEGDK